MTDFFVVRSQQITPIWNGIKWNNIAAICKLICHQKIAEINHKIRVVLELVLQTTGIDRGIRLTVKMRICLNDKLKSFSCGPSGMK